MNISKAPSGYDDATFKASDLDFEAVAQEKIAAVTNNTFEVYNNANMDWTP